MSALWEVATMRKFRLFLRWQKMRQVDAQLRSMAIGMNSTVSITEDLHIVMLDYDIHDIAKVRKSVWELQDFWKLSDAYIFRTKNGHHVFFWYDQVPYERLKMIINFAKYVDPMYKYISRYHDHKTIRVSKKYQFRDINFVEKLDGCRTPSQDEREVGKLKQQEHKLLLDALEA